MTAAALALSVAAAALTGCSAQTEPTEKKETAAQEQSAGESRDITEEQRAGKAQIAITITDAAGRGVMFEKPAERIVSGYYITTSMLIALGLEDRVVGIEAKADKRPIYRLAAPEFLELPSVGTAKEFDLEGCAALRPDLVILPMKLSEQADILAGMGIAAMVVNPESTDALEKTITDIAGAAGVGERADKLLAYYDEQTARLQSINETAGAGGRERPSVYVAGTSGVLRAATPAMYQNSLIELAGGVNAASDLTDKGWADISYEQLLAYDPDLIIVIPEADYTKEDVLADPQLQTVKAVQNQAVYEMPSAFEAWDSPVTSGILGCMWLSSVVNEEQYAFDVFKEDAAAFYKEFYEVEIDTDLITK